MVRFRASVSKKSISKRRLRNLIIEQLEDRRVLTIDALNFVLATDTGPSNTDGITSDPTLYGHVSGDTSNYEYVEVEFDHDGDGFSEGYAPIGGLESTSPIILHSVYYDPRDFQWLYDGPITINYRAVAYGLEVEYQEWQSISFNLQTGSSGGGSSGGGNGGVGGLSVTNVHLQNDTGSSNTDLVTTDSTLSSTVVGDFESYSEVRVEFDSDGDNIAEAAIVVGSPNVPFLFDPKDYDTGLIDFEGLVNINYRVLGFDYYYEVAGVGPWQTFSFTLQSDSTNGSGGATGGSLISVVDVKLKNDNGQSSSDLITSDPRITGRLSGAFWESPGCEFWGRVEFDLNEDGVADGYSETFSPTTPWLYDPRFDSNLSEGPVVISFRGAVLSTVTQQVVETTNWATIDFNLVQPPTSNAIVSSISLLNDTGLIGDKLTADPTLKLVTSGVTGELRIEFDHNGDGNPDGTISNGTNNNYSQHYDPSWYDPDFLKNYGDVSIRYRLFESIGGFLTQPSEWATFSFTLSPFGITWDTATNISPNDQLDLGTSELNTFGNSDPNFRLLIIRNNSDRRQALNDVRFTAKENSLEILHPVLVPVAPLPNVLEPGEAAAFRVGVANNLIIDSLVMASVRGNGLRKLFELKQEFTSACVSDYQLTDTVQHLPDFTHNPLPWIDGPLVDPPVTYTVSEGFKAGVDLGYSYGNGTFTYSTRDGTAQSGSDYQPISGQIQVNGRFSVEIQTNLDLVREGTEYFFLDIITPSGEPITIPYFIQSNELELTYQKEVVLTEGDSANVLLTLGSSRGLPPVPELPSNLSFHYQTRNRTAVGSSGSQADYRSVSGDFDLSQFPFTQSISIPTFLDLTTENLETFVLEVDTPWGTKEEVHLLLKDGLARIPRVAFGNNESEALLAPGGFLLSEGESRQIGIGIAQPFSLPVDVHYETFPISASASDFVSLNGTIHFEPGETWKPIVLTALNDFRIEQEEYFAIALDTPWGQIQEATVKILPEMLPDLHVSDVSVVGGNQASFEISIESAMTRPFTVYYQTTDGSAVGTTSGYDYSTTYGSIVFNPGETSKLVSVTTTAKYATPDENGYYESFEDHLDFYLDVTSDWLRDRGHAVIHYPGGYNSSNAVDAMGGYAHVNLRDLTDGNVSTYYPYSYQGTLQGIGLPHAYASLVTPPTHGDVRVYADGTYAYRPHVGFVGADSFRFAFNDGVNHDEAIESLLVYSWGFQLSDIDSIMASQNHGVTQSLLPSAPQLDPFQMIGGGINLGSYANEFPWQDGPTVSILPSGRIEYANLPSGFNQQVPYVISGLFAEDITGWPHLASADIQIKHKSLKGSVTLQVPTTENDADIEINELSFSAGVDSEQFFVGNIMGAFDGITLGQDGLYRDNNGRPYFARPVAVLKNTNLPAPTPNPYHHPDEIEAGMTTSGGKVRITVSGDVYYSSSHDFVGMDKFAFELVPEDGLTETGSSRHVASASIEVGAIVTARPDPDPLNQGLGNYHSKTWTPNGIDEYVDQGVRGFFAWNNGSGALLQLDGLGIVANDSIFTWSDLSGRANWRIEFPDCVSPNVPGLSYNMTTGAVAIWFDPEFVGDISIPYILHSGIFQNVNGFEQELKNSSHMVVSVHGHRPPTPELGVTWLPPAFVSTPPVTATVGEEYQYTPFAVDPQNFSLNYMLLSGPSGMTLNPVSHRLTWTPQSVGTSETISIIVVNDHGGYDIQEFAVAVLPQGATPNNHAPVFVSTPITSGTVGDEYVYEVKAQDVDGDTLRFTLTAPSDWTLVDNLDGTGSIRHLGTPADFLTPPHIEVAVFDTSLDSAKQSFEVQFQSNNQPPTITSTPKIRFEKAGAGLTSIGDVSVLTPEDQNGLHSLWLNLGSGDSENASIKFSIQSGPPKVDVMLLLDDTGSFDLQNSMLASSYPELVQTLIDTYPNIDFGFGVSRYEDFLVNLDDGNTNQEAVDGRPFILNQAIVSENYPRLEEVLRSALGRPALGFGGGDSQEALIEALYQLASGTGFNGGGSGSTWDGGAAGSLRSQIAGGDSRDVPRSQVGNSVSNFTADTSIHTGFRAVRVGDQPELPLGQSVETVFDESYKASVWKYNATPGQDLVISSSSWFDRLSVYGPLGNKLQPVAVSGENKTYRFLSAGVVAVVDHESRLQAPNVWRPYRVKSI
ncbi:MAG: Calx-beta domain-containing protein [Pirellulales bacterium]